MREEKQNEKEKGRRQVEEQQFGRIEKISHWPWNSASQRADVLSPLLRRTICPLRVNSTFNGTAHVPSLAPTKVCTVIRARLGPVLAGLARAEHGRSARVVQTSIYSDQCPSGLEPIGYGIC